MIRKVGRAIQLFGLLLVVVAYPLLGRAPAVHAAGKISLSPASTTMTEGQTQDVTVALSEPIISADPPGFVQVYVSSNTQSRLALNESFVEFAENEWSQHKTFSVTAPDDALLNGDQTITLSFNIYSNSEFYNQYAGSTTITVHDNEVTPQASITSPKAGQNIPAGSLMVTGTATQGFQVAVIIDGKNEGTTTSDESGNWSVLVPKVSGGNHDIKAQVQISAHYGYMANAYTGSIDVVNIDTHSYVYEIAGARSVGAVYNKQKNIVYSASNADDGSCGIRGYNPLTYVQVANFTRGTDCHARSMFLNADGNTAWLLYDFGDSPSYLGVMQVNLNSGTSSEHTLGAIAQYNADNPSGIAVNPSQTEIWVRITNGIRVYSATDYSLTDTIQLGVSDAGGEHNIVFNKAGTHAYTTDLDGTLYDINTSTKTAADPIVIGAGSKMVALTPDESQLYVAASYPTSAIYVVDLSNNSIVDHFEVDQFLPPESIAFADDGQWVVGDDHGSGAIFFGNATSGPTVSHTIYAPAGGSYYTTVGGFASPTLVKVLGVSTTMPFSATTYTVPNTGFGLSQ